MLTYLRTYLKARSSVKELDDMAYASFGSLRKMRLQSLDNKHH